MLLDAHICNNLHNTFSYTCDPGFRKNSKWLISRRNHCTNHPMSDHLCAFPPSPPRHGPCGTTHTPPLLPAGHVHQLYSLYLGLSTPFLDTSSEILIILNETCLPCLGLVGKFKYLMFWNVVCWKIRWSSFYSSFMLVIDFRIGNYFQGLHGFVDYCFHFFFPNMLLSY